MTPDVNVLLAAARSDHAHHAVASTWLRQALKSASRGAPLCLQGMVIASFLRLSTHPKIFQHPMPIADALKFIESLLSLPGVHQPQLGDEWQEFQQLCQQYQLTSNDIPDAWLAAAVLRQSEHLASFDAGFSRWLPRSRFTLLRPLGSKGSE